MAKTKNKGFSLIEIVIAIAILTLLLTPIVKQLADTMKTNRVIKAQQHASEDAQYVMEYFQNESLDTLADTSDTTRPIYVDDTKGGLVSYTGDDAIECTIYPTMDDGTVDTAHPLSDKILYNAYVYNLNDLEVSNTSTTYARQVVLDDLSIKIMSTPFKLADNKEYSYRVNYDFDTAVDGFTLTNEGSLVMYDTNNRVVGIVCKQQGLFEENGINNPNEVNLGNVHDLNANYMPIVNGDSTNYDKQAEKEFYARAMNRLKDTDNEAWNSEIASDDDDPNHTYLGGEYFTSMKKMTEIKMWEDEEETGNYYFSVNVYYENTYLAEGGKPEQLSYNVFTQAFPKREKDKNGRYRSVHCPDMYYEYQPFLISKVDNSNVQFVQNDYLIIDNSIEPYENAKGEKVYPKIYLYKPFFNAVTSYINKDTIKNSGYDENAVIFSPDKNYFVDYRKALDPATAKTTVRNSSEKVRIGIFSANEITEDNKVEIYTNLDAKDEIVKLQARAAEGDSEVTADVLQNPQFVTKKDEALFIYDQSPYNAISVFDSAFKIYDEADSTVGTSRNFYSYDTELLLGIDDENNTENRFFTVSVLLTPDNGKVSRIRLNGAKGGN